MFLMISAIEASAKVSILGFSVGRKRVFGVNTDYNVMQLDV